MRTRVVFLFSLFHAFLFRPFMLTCCVVLPATAHLASGGPTGVCLRVRVFAGKALGVVPQSLGDM